MKPRVVFDTNIYISAILFGGRPGEAFLLAKQDEIELYISPAIIAELAAKLTEKFYWQTERVTVVLKELGEIAIVIRPESRLNAIRADDSDNRILECAVMAKADYVISGDRKHLLPLKRYEGIEIISTARFLKMTGKP